MSKMHCLKRRRHKICEQKEKQSPPNINDILNNDSLVKIFSHLNLTERIQIESVCKRWQEASQLSWLGFRTFEFKKSFWGFSNKARLTVSNHILQEVLRRCGTYLTSFEFSNYSYYSCYYNKFLNVSLSQRGVVTIFHLCPNLRKLSISFYHLRAGALTELTTNCPDIEELCLRMDRYVCKTEFSNLLASKKNLRCLELDVSWKNCKEINTCLKNLPASLESLTIRSTPSCYLRLYIFEPSDIGVRLPKLFTMLLMDCLISYPKLIMTESEMNSIGQSHLMAFENLRKLSLVNCSETGDEFLIDVANSCTNLEELTLIVRQCDPYRYHYVTDKGLSAIAVSLKNLKHLELENIYDVSGQDFGKMQNLHYFKCFCASVSETNICKLMQAADKLQKLDLIPIDIYSPQLLQKAVEATQIRDNGVILTIRLCIKISDTDVIKISESPLLQVEVVPQQPRYWHEYNILRRH